MGGFKQKLRQKQRFVVVLGGIPHLVRIVPLISEARAMAGMSPLVNNKISPGTSGNSFMGLWGKIPSISTLHH